MAKYHTEGTIKTIELVDNKPTVKLDPVAPYRFATKKNGKEVVRILFEENEDEFHPTIVFSNAETETGVHIEIAESDGTKRTPVTSLELSCKQTDGVLTLQKPDDAKEKCILAFLSDGDSQFSIGGELKTTVDFAALLTLKQNRTKLRIDVLFDPSTQVLSNQIEKVSICD